jgi:predicted small secreted protein
MNVAAFFKGAAVGVAAGAVLTAAVIPVDRRKIRRMPAVKMAERLLDRI